MPFWGRQEIALWAAAAAAIFGLSACSDSAPATDSGRPIIVTSTSIWADIVTNITCGELVDVFAIVPPGADPHAFEPSLADRGLIDRAALVVINGLGLEENLEDTLEAAANNGAAVVRVGDQIEPLRFSPSVPDPHFWFDPVLVAETLPWLAERVSSRANLDIATVNECTAAYIEELISTDQELSKVFSSVPADRRKMVTNHDSLGYLADRYGLEIVATVLGSESSLGEASPFDLKQVAEKIAAEGVTVIFTDVQSSAADAEALAESLGEVELVELNTGTLGPKGSTTGTYIELLRTNAELIALGLTG